MTSDTGAQIIDKAKEMGASMAGIANVELLKKSPSHEIIKKLGMEIDGVNPYREICDSMKSNGLQKPGQRWLSPFPILKINLS